MAKRKAKRAGQEAVAKEGEALLTLTEISKRTGISMPTLQKYKKNHQDRIPSEGKGRKQRYPAAALAVFEELKAENLKRRGRPPKAGKKASSGTPRKKGAPKASGGGLLSLAEISRRTKISYPTLLRYLEKHGAEIPAVGKGRKRRFPPAAIAVFEKLRGQSRRGPKRKPAAAARVATAQDPRLAARVEKIERMQAEVSKQLDEIVGLLKQPLHVTIRPE